MHLIIEQEKVLFYRRVLRSSNVILQTLLCLKQRSVNSLTSLYNIRLKVSCDAIKQSIWQYNVRNAVDTGCLTLRVFHHILFFLLPLFYFFMWVFMCLHLCVRLFCAASGVINDDDDDDDYPVGRCSSRKNPGTR